MKIKGMSGEEYSVTGQGQGNLNTVLGSAGLASFFWGECREYPWRLW